MDNTQPKKGLHPLVWAGIGCGCLVLIVVGFVVAGTGFVAFKAKEAVEDFQKNPEEATAKLIAFANPDLELVETDSEARTVTFRNTKDGKDFTVDYDDIKDGKLTIQTPEGEMTFNAEQGEDGGSLTIQGPEGETRVTLDGNQNGEGGQLRIEGPDGQVQQFGASQDLEDVPSWVPLYPQATSAEAGFTSTSDQGEAGLVTVKTNESTDAVKEFYQEKLEGEGYEIRHQTITSGGKTHATVTGEKAGTTVNVMITQDESGETVIALQYNGKSTP